MCETTCTVCTPTPYHLYRAEPTVQLCLESTAVALHAPNGTHSHRAVRADSLQRWQHVTPRPTHSARGTAVQCTYCTRVQYTGHSSADPTQFRTVPPRTIPTKTIARQTKLRSPHSFTNIPVGSRRTRMHSQPHPRCEDFGSATLLRSLTHPTGRRAHLRLACLPQHQRSATAPPWLDASNPSPHSPRLPGRARGPAHATWTPQYQSHTHARVLPSLSRFAALPAPR